MLKAVLVKVRQSFVEMVASVFPVEIFVKEVIPLLRLRCLDMFQFYLVRELFCA